MKYTMNLKKIIHSLMLKKAQQYKHKKYMLTKSSQIIAAKQKKENYITKLEDKYRENNYNNIPYIKDEESAEYVLNNWNTSAPVPRAYMKNQIFKGKKLVTGEIVLLWWLTSRKNTNSIPLYFYREYGINANESIKKLQRYGLLSTEKRLTLDGKQLLKNKQKIIHNHKTDKTWAGIGPIKYHYNKVKEAEELENATYQEYLDSGIKQYSFLATLDTKTCSICGNLDGKIFDIKETKTGINYPLIHPGCRCTTMPYIEGLPDSSERWARNPKTGKGEYIDNISFNKWKSKYI
ncbi:minor capsid protein [Lactobacillus sp. ESL0230]|uniref:minor capsid protein n=1 Tax=Lactobacillus sp. ESL0230 TaxID=2069353 RepID=UPI000EFD847C|nr:minor capsid protein [Lactobacillus sp. ESL0230]RMC46586.1 hypothetical protein F5ESL0230_04835 [Lactobacillus sp. ESL0230]